VFLPFAHVANPTVHLSCPQEAKDAEEEAPAEEPATEAAQTTGEEEEIDIDLEDPDVARAATKIQASFRGHKSRKDMTQRKVCTSYFIVDH
jgi:hypothetical protein